MSTSTTTQAERQDVGLQAAYQAESLLNALLRTAYAGDSGELPFLVQGMIPRLLELNSVTMAVHDPASEDLALIRDRLHGGYGPHVLAENYTHQAQAATEKVAKDGSKGGHHGL